MRNYTESMSFKKVVGFIVNNIAGAALQTLVAHQLNKFLEKKKEEKPSEEV